MSETPNIDQNKLDTFMKAMQQYQDKTAMVVLLELLKNDKTIDGHLPLISESPNVSYTKLLTKLATYRASINELLNLQPEKYDEDREFEDVIVHEMIRYFLTYMVGHKRRRAIEIVHGVKGDQQNLTIEAKRKGLFGFR